MHNARADHKLEGGGLGPGHCIAGPGQFISEKAANDGDQSEGEAEGGGRPSLRLSLVVEIGGRQITLGRGIVQRVMVRAALLVGGAMRWALIG